MISSAKGAARTSKRVRNWPAPRSVLRVFVKKTRWWFHLTVVVLFNAPSVPTVQRYQGSGVGHPRAH
jgi:hypothetical protein